MAVTKATRNPTSNLAHAAIVVTVALGLVIGAFTVGCRRVVQWGRRLVTSAASPAGAIDGTLRVLVPD